MKTISLRLILPAILVVGLWGSAYVMAEQTEPPKQPEITTIVGTVQTTLDKDGKIISVEILVEKAVYNVVQDAKSAELSKFNGKNVEVKGTVAEKEGLKWLTVVSHRLAPETTTITGTVRTTLDKDGKIISVELLAEKAVYNVVQDDKGAELSKLNGKNVEVKGTVAEKEGLKWLTVISHKLVVEPAPTKTPAPTQRPAPAKPKEQ